MNKEKCKLIDFNKKTKDLNRFEKTVLITGCLLITLFILMIACWIGYALESDAFTSKFG
ncbi:TPA: hypothetical protein ACGC1F_001957 [Acinetobacter baumannii]|nr:hypothetical protein [Acinetobacter baumannii]